jgi:hypothetical protein
MLNYGENELIGLVVQTRVSYTNDAIPADVDSNPGRTTLEDQS